MMIRLRGGIIAKSAASERQLLNAATDFTYLGKYVAAYYPSVNSEDYYAQGLTHRYVGNQLRLMWLGFNGNTAPDTSVRVIREATIPENYDDVMPIIASHSHVWESNPGAGWWTSVWWDSVSEKIWTASGADYPSNETERSSVMSMRARSIGTTSGECTNHSLYHGMAGIQQRASMGKMGRVPAWAVSSYGFKEFYSLSGGYASLMSFGVSLGPMFTSFDNPLDFTGSANFFDSTPSIPEGSRQILADCRSGTSTTDWYSGGYASRTKERGCRVANVENEYDFDAWLSKPDLQPPGDPDGWNRWVWGDTYAGSGNWIDNDAGTRSKHGIVLVQKLGTGRAYYQNSQLNNDGTAYEFVVYDPADLYAVKQGALDAWKIRPKSIASIPVSDLSYDETLTPTIVANLGATFDATTNKLYILVGGHNLYTMVVVYQVAGF